MIPIGNPSCPARPPAPDSTEIAACLLRLSDQLCQLARVIEPPHPGRDDQSKSSFAAYGDPLECPDCHKLAYDGEVCAFCGCED